MDAQTVSLRVPAEATYARSVRMLAANLAVVCGMGIEDVEDVRMAAEESFVYSCATEPEICELTFGVENGTISLNVSLGLNEAAKDETQYACLLLAAICDEFEVNRDTQTLRLLMRTGAAHV